MPLEAQTSACYKLVKDNDVHVVESGRTLLLFSKAYIGGMDGEGLSGTEANV